MRYEDLLKKCLRIWSPCQTEQIYKIWSDTTMSFPNVVLIYFNVIYIIYNDRLYLLSNSPSLKATTNFSDTFKVPILEPPSCVITDNYWLVAVGHWWRSIVETIGSTHVLRTFSFCNPLYPLLSLYPFFLSLGEALVRTQVKMSLRPSVPPSVSQ